MTRTKRLAGWVGLAVLAGAVTVVASDSSFAQPKGGKAPAGGGKVAQPAKAKPKKKCAAVDVDKAKAGDDELKKKEAGKAYKEGEKAYKAKDWECAFELFSAADSIRPGAKPKYYAGSAADKLGKVKEALAMYNAFLDGNPDPAKNADLIKDAKARVDVLKVTPGKLKITVDPPNAKVIVDGQETSSLELSLAGGKHRLQALADKYETSTQDVEVKPADLVEIHVKLTPKAVEPPPPPPTQTAIVVATGQPTSTGSAAPAPPPPKQERSKIPAIVTLSLAGAGTVVGVVFGVLALDSKGKFDQTPTTPLADETDRNALIADMSFAVAITFAVTGTVLLLTSGGDDEKKEEKKAAKFKPKPVVVPMVLPNGGGIAGAVRF